jgi:Uma2 family endonuclease
MTEEEFVAWCDEDVRAEWVDGEVIVMSPANFIHGRLVLFLSRILADFVEFHKLGIVPGPDYFVRLPTLARRRIPDLMFIAQNRVQLISENHLEGSPDLVVEIVSPDSEARDWREKYHDYEAAGVREYWVIDPNSPRVEAYALGADAKFRCIEETDGRIASTVLPGLHLRTAWLWQDPLPLVGDVLKELGVR